MRRYSLLLVAAACSDGKVPPAPPPSQVPPEIVNSAREVVDRGIAAAKPAAGSIEIAKAWVYTPAPELAAGRRWIAIDVDFGKADIDPDHVDLADADGKYVAALGDIARLDATGQRIPLMNPEHSTEAHYLLSFEMPASTKRVSLQYWGETLTRKPAEITPSGPTFAEASRRVIRHFADGKRHVLIFEDQHQDRPPSAITNHVKSDAGECAMLAILPVDAKLRPVATSLEPTIDHALYAADYECNTPPTTFELGRTYPLPAAERLAVPPETLTALEGRAPNIRVLFLPATSVKLAVRVDGTLIAVAPTGDQIRLIAPDGAEVGRLDKLDDPIWIAFTPDGKHLVSVDGDRGVALWDVAARTSLATRTLDPAPDDIYCKPVLSANGRLLAVDHAWTKPDDTRVAWSGQITMLDAATLAPMWNAKLVDGNQGSLAAISMSRDSARVVACWGESHDLDKTVSTVRVLSAVTGKPEVSFSSDKIIGTCAFAPDGKILVGYGDGLATYDARGKLISKQTGEAMPTSIASAPDGSLVSAGGDGYVTRWRRGPGERIAALHFRTPAFGAWTWGSVLVGYSGFEVVVLDRDGKVAQRLRGAADGIGQVVTGNGVLAVVEWMIDARRSRLRIVHL